MLTGKVSYFFDPGITVRHLLAFTSGITSYFFEEDIDPDYEALWLQVPVYRPVNTL